MADPSRGPPLRSEVENFSDRGWGISVIRSTGESTEVPRALLALLPMRSRYLTTPFASRHRHMRDGIDRRIRHPHRSTAATPPRLRLGRQPPALPGRPIRSDVTSKCEAETSHDEDVRVEVSGRYSNHADQEKRIGEVLRFELARSPEPKTQTLRRSQRRLSGDELESLLKSYEQGTRVNLLANQFGIHRSTVMDHLMWAINEHRDL